MRRRDFTTGIAVAAIARPLAAHAQRWPTQLVRIVCPLAAGGGIDATARIVAAHLSEIWGQQVVVENKSGASGNIAAEFVARSDPDGYTIYIATFPHATNSYLYPSLGYDPVADFAPVGLVGYSPTLMVANTTVPVKDVNGLTLLAKDEHMRPATTMQSQAQLKPSFAQIGELAGFDAVAIQAHPEIEAVNHVHHAGNSSGIVDGAAAVLVGNAEAGRRASAALARRSPRRSISGWPT